MQDSTMMEAKVLIQEYLEAQISPFVWGPPGVGKSDLIREIAKEDDDAPVIDIRLIQFDPVDMRGLPTVKDGTTKWNTPDFLPTIKKDGKKGYLFLDEMMTAPPALQAMAFQLVLDRRIGDYKFPDGWHIVAASNRQSDRSGANRMYRALANRFSHISIVPDVESFLEWGMRNGIDPYIISFFKLQKNKDKLHSMAGADDLAFPTPRGWARANRFIKHPPKIRRKLISGIIGDGVAAELEGHILMFDKLPPIKSIINNPKTADIPDEPSAKYMIVTALARHATRENMRNIVTYIERIDREFVTVFMREAIAVTPGLANSKAYIDYAAESNNG